MVQNSSDINLDAHYSNNRKVKVSKKAIAEAPPVMPKNRYLTDAEMSKKIGQLNQDIYEKTEKEKKKNGFSVKKFIAIFGIVALFTLLCTNIHRIKKFFK